MQAEKSTVTLEVAGISTEMEVSKIIPYSQNAKLHTKEQIEEIKKSIQKNGYYQEIAIDEDNVILVGHGRLEAIKQLGYKKVGVKRLTGLSELEKKELRLKDNLINSMTGYNLELLKIEQEEIVELGGNLESG
jgi:ParB-like chromosome segregation protein Spo0J